MKMFYSYLFYLIFFTNNINAQIRGCTDPLATNYNVAATQNDGSCSYKDASISPLSSFNLTPILTETSGLIKWDNRIWTFNDNSDINLYSLDTINGKLIQSYSLGGTINNDWEELSQDSNYLYVGDFGNTYGNRTDLKILRIDKNSILIHQPIIDTINFSYSNQTDFTTTGSNKTDFDCEAFVVSSDSIFLFTKQWISNKTSVYSHPKFPGTYSANLLTTFDIKGLITGAVLLESKRIIALCGYSNLLQPFVFLLYDFHGSDYFSGNKRKIAISLPFYQIEGIATTNGQKYYLSNEYFSQAPIVNVPQRFHIVDLKAFLGKYLNKFTSIVPQAIQKDHISIYPNPANDIITIEIESSPTNYHLMNYLGQTVRAGLLTKGNSRINISGLSEGMYFLKVGEANRTLFKLIKR